MSYIGKIPATGNFVKLDAISVVNGQAAYTMQSDSVNFTPESANHMLVSLNGVIQAPISSFTISGSTITFASALSTGDIIDFIMVYGNVLDIGTPSDDTISASKLQTDSVIEAKIQNDAVTRDKINAISTSSLPSFEAKGDGSSVEGKIQLNCHVNSHGVVLQSPPHSSGQSYTIKLPDNQIAVDKFIKVKSITGSGSTAVGQTEFADAGGGKIGQVVSGTLTSSFATTSTSFVATGLDVDITPSATSSKVFVIATCYLDDNTSAHQVYSTLYRDSTNLGQSNGMMSSYGAGGRLRSNHTMSFLDSPSSTSSLNYEVFVKGDGNTISFNSESATVSITAMEVLA